MVRDGSEARKFLIEETINTNRPVLKGAKCSDCENIFFPYKSTCQIVFLKMLRNIL